MMALMQVPAKAAQFFLTAAANNYTLLLLINVLLLVLGTSMDLAPMLLICTPIFLPMLFVLILVTYVPALCLWLRSLLKF
jgi:TRAP-type C4-dicarboxylate transport system permease large subunit